MASWIARDPIPAFGGLLTEREIFTGADLEALQTAAREEIEGAVAFAEASPEPEPAVLAGAVYAPHVAHVEPTERGTRELTFAQALNEAMAQEMARDESVFLMGEDVADTGGIFQVSKGLLERFGRERVRDTPISEATFCGAGVGAAIAGMRPIVEVQIFDFVTLMMDMLVNQAAKFRYMLGGRPTVPLVVRGPQGGGIRLAPQHSQSLEAWFAHVPGLVVVAPASAYDAKGLLIAAILDQEVLGYMVPRPVAVREALEKLQQVYLFDVVESDWTLAFRKRERDPVLTVGDESLAAHEPGSQRPPKLLETRTQEAELPRRVTLRYLARENDYQAAAQQAQLIQDLYETKNELVLELPVVMTDDEAKRAACDPGLGLGRAPAHWPRAGDKRRRRGPQQRR